MLQQPAPQQASQQSEGGDPIVNAILRHRRAAKREAMCEKAVADHDANMAAVLCN